jgi:hypothetical protein
MRSCARAASGHATAAPPSSVMNSRRLMSDSADGFDVHEMHCKVLVARANKRGDYLAKFRCDDNLIQNYWFSLFNNWQARFGEPFLRPYLCRLANVVRDHALLLPDDAPPN